MTSVITQRNRLRLWREPDIGGAELLRAEYRAHQFPPHAHDELALGVIERGAQSFTGGRGRHALMVEGTVCVINPGVVHEGRAATKDGWDYRMIYLPVTSLDLILGDLDVPLVRVPYFPQPVIRDPETFRLIRAAHVCCESAECSQLEKTSRLTIAVCQLVARHSAGCGSNDRLMCVPGAITRAREYIDARLAANPTLPEIAHVAGMSPYHLLREFKKTLGVAPHGYLVQRRVDRARHLVVKGRPLQAVAMELGYCDAGHLSREFSRFFGVSPGAVRQ